MKSVLIEGVSFAVSDDTKKVEVFETNPDYVVGQKVTGRTYRINGDHGVFVDHGVHIVTKDDLANVRPLGYNEVKEVKDPAKTKELTPAPVVEKPAAGKPKPAKK